MTTNNYEIIKNLKPNRLWWYFGKISSIPRPSTKEDKIRDYIIEFAKENNLQYNKDNIGNIVLYKPSQNKPNNRESDTIILQAHLDMVCEANSDVDIDFENEPIKLKLENDVLKAQETTLGADNGIGVAIILALLEDKEICHPPIEALFTVDEESGLTGALGLDTNLLNGEYLINLDSEIKNEVYIGCAGGENIESIYKLKKEKLPKNFSALKIKISGLNGGHSGVDIHKNFGNAIKFIVNIISYLITNDIYFNIIHINGGNKFNSIPRYAEITIAFDSNEKDKIKNILECRINGLIENYKKDLEKNIKIEMNEINTAEDTEAINYNQSKNIIGALNSVHQGIHRIIILDNKDTKDMFVETSNNLGVLKWNGDSIKIINCCRSSDEFQLTRSVQQIYTIFKLAGADEIQLTNKFPAWKPLSEDKNLLLKKYRNFYKNKIGILPELKSIHAGLECGVFKEKFPNIRMISIGPDIKEVHCPNENVKVSDVAEFWDIFINFIQSL